MEGKESYLVFKMSLAKKKFQVKVIRLAGLVILLHNDFFFIFFPKSF